MIALVLTIGAAAAVAGAAPAGSAETFTQRLVGAEWRRAVPDGYVTGSIEIVKKERVAHDAPGLTSTMAAQAWLQTCLRTEYYCSFESFPKQTVPGKGLKVNHVTGAAMINLCLVPESGGRCRRFTLSMTNPKGGPDLGARCGGQLIFWCVYASPDGSGDPVAMFEGGPGVVWYQHRVTGRVGRDAVAGDTGYVSFNLTETNVIASN